MIKDFKIELKCLFCDSVLQGDTEKEYLSGDLIKCQNCNEENDYDSLITIVKEKAEVIAKKQAEEEIKKMFKNLKL